MKWLKNSQMKKKVLILIFVVVLINLVFLVNAINNYAVSGVPFENFEINIDEGSIHYAPFNETHLRKNFFGQMYFPIEDRSYGMNFSFMAADFSSIISLWAKIDGNLDLAQEFRFIHDEKPDNAYYKVLLSNESTINMFVRNSSRSFYLQLENTSAQRNFYGDVSR